MYGVKELPCGTVIVLALVVVTVASTGMTTSVTFAVRTSLDELVPVIVIVYVPPSVVAAGLTVSVELPPAATEVGDMLTVAPDGYPLTVRAMLPVNPFSAPTATPYAAVSPARSVADAGEAETAKSGVTTVRLTIVV